ncbi:MAG: hypothetical protein AAF078_08595, partial [Planctomycetota bacterium]
HNSVLGILWSGVVVLVAALLGFVLAGIFGGIFVLLPIYEWWRAKNGAPFRIGDSVMILGGPHRGQVKRIYEVWATRSQVRVELSDIEREEVRDVLSDIAVRRQSDVA